MSPLPLSRAKGMPSRTPVPVRRMMPVFLPVLLTCALTARPRLARAETADSPDHAPAHTMLIQVVYEETGKSVPEALLDIAVDRVHRNARADEHGQYRLELPDEKIEMLEIGVSRPGLWSKPPRSWRRCEKQIVWKTHQPAAPLQLPEKCVFALEPLAPIGGSVQDADGKPLADVKVTVEIVDYRSAPPEGEPFTFINHQTITDERGRWRCETVPRKLPQNVGRFEVAFDHPDFERKELFPLTSGPMTVEALQAESAVTVLDEPRVPAITIAGRVTNPQGEPIGGAHVTAAAMPASDAPSAVTNSAGRFELPGIRPNRYWKNEYVILVITADGYASDFHQVRLGGEDVELDIQLDAQQPLRGRVVDVSGRPLAGVTVSASRSMGSPFTVSWEDRFLHLDWETQTDEDGRFVWEAAPLGEVPLDIELEGFTGLSDVTVSERDKEQVFTLHKPVRVTGTVREAETGHPVDRFTVIPGTVSEGARHAIFSPPFGAEYTDGRYDLVIPFYEHPGYRLRIEADGYMRADSPIFVRGDGDVTWDATLRRPSPDDGPAGVVRKADGTPVPDAHVVLCAVEPAFGRVPTFRNGVFDEKSCPESVGNHLATTTDEAGRFSFPYQVNPYTIAVMHDEGAAVWFSEDGSRPVDLRLRPFGRVEGVYRIGTKRGAGEHLRLRSARRPAQNPPGIDAGFVFDVKTDASGRFVIDNVPAGKAFIGPYEDIFYDRLGFGTRRWVYSRPVQVEAGETTKVQLGGWGPSIVGQFVAPPKVEAQVAEQIDWRRADVSIKRRLPDLPESIRSSDPQARRKWLQQWQQSEEGQAYAQSVKRYSVRVRSNGTFRADDLMPGPYRIQVSWRERPGDPGEAVGRLQYDFEVPPVDGEIDDTPIMIGAIILSPVSHEGGTAERLEAGDPAPGFDLVDVTGRRWNLADLRGRYVLLKFWAHWCGPCLADMPRIDELHDEFRDDSRLVILGLNLDAEEAKLKDYIREHAIAWPQVHLGDWYATPLPGRYGVASLPATILIGPDGHIAVPNIRGAMVQPLVRRAVKQARQEAP